jgi:hypothetical protein
MSTSEDRFSLSGPSPPSIPAPRAGPADADLHAVLRRGEYCLVFTPPELGKLARVQAAAHLRAEGAAIVVLALAETEQHRAAEPWYHALLGTVGQQLGLEEEIERFWREHDHLSALQRWMAAVREIALPRCPGPLVIFIDEVEAARRLPFSVDEFFAAIRECYNRRTQDPEFYRLTFCLLGAARLSELIRDSRTTAFNIGQRIDLTDAARIEPPSGDPERQHKHRMPAVLQRALDWISGEPYACAREARAAAPA